MRVWLKSSVYERTATVPEIEADLAVIRAVRARSKGRWPLFLLGILGSLAGGVAMAAALRDPPGSPMALGLGVVLAIVVGVFWSMEPDPEPKRVEMASGVLRRLKLEPGSQVIVKLDLAPLETGRKKKLDRNEGGWSVEYHHDDWLQIEGRLEGAVAFRYSRAASQKKAVHVEVRGNTRITRTRTEGWFHDAVQLRFSPEQYPAAAQVGPDGYKKLKMPEGFETKHFSGTPGALELTVTSDRKWDAGQPGQKLDGGDAVKIAGLWFSILYDFLEAGREPYRLEGDIPPSPTTSVPTIDGKTIVGLVTHPAFAACVLVLPGLLFMFNGGNRISRSSWYGEQADRYEREAKTAKDRAKQASAKADAKRYRDLEDERVLDGGIQLGVGAGMFLLGGAAGTVLYLRRRKQAAEDAAAKAASPALLPAGGPPPQGGYGPPQQGGYGPPPQQGGYGPPPQQGGYGPPQQGGYGAPPQPPPGAGPKKPEEW